MIHTVTVNPAIDLTYRVPQWTFDDTTRARSVLRAPGGKGVNVSRVATRLGHETVAMGLVGGRTGDEIEDLLRDEGVRTWFSRHDGPTRSNVIVQDDTGRQLRISAPGPDVGEAEVEALLAALFDLRAPDFLVASGSLLPGVPSDLYARIAVQAAADGVPMIVDADRELASAIAAGVALTKPNAYELGRLVGRDVVDVTSAVTAAREAVAMGARVVVCSLGAHGAVWVSDEGAWHATPPRVKVDSALGAGDSLLAGVLVARARGASPAEALQLGVACGTATAMTPGTELCHRVDVEALLDRVVVETITERSR